MGARSAAAATLTAARFFVSMMLLSLPLAVTPRLPMFPLVMAELFLAMFVAGGFIILAMAYATRTFSAEHSGLIAGLGAGAWSAAVAVVMPVFGRLFDRGQVQAAFALAAGLPVVGYVLWSRVNAEGSL